MISKQLFLTTLFLVLTTHIFATDRIVQENGPAGTFNTISEAITASIDGDRIVIYPKIGDSPYVENININKALEFVTAQDGVRYKIQGNITIEASDNRKVTIIGAHLVSGNIEGTTSGWRTNVNIMGCFLEGGNITFNNQYYVSIVSNILQNGNISLSHGNVIGNDLVTELRTISIANSTSIQEDSMNIIANKVTQIICTSNITLNIYNNFIKRSLSTTSNFSSISYSYTSVDTKLYVLNNTIVNPASSTSGSFNYYVSSSSRALISNNQFLRVVTPSSLVGNHSFFSLPNGFSGTYNYYYNTTTKLNQIPTEVSDNLGSINLLTGSTIFPALSQNGANPSFEFYDLDLSPGDAGCYGGSYSLDNYFPITGSSRVYWIDTPFGITTTGAPLQIKAEGFDR
ncbi:MAG TPA: hypothetical protein PLL09_03275 [Flavobacterium sp.]|uniref:hypothetical protein n=1 Tax=unclassified Flavobacterium TaxID=196869 RepID=UPI0025BAA66D|nr:MULTISPECIES: hypothetical protein [unclassified Flavobacterium]HRE76826.1 hypothetical protein [Flavobacterium sp.]